MDSDSEVDIGGLFEWTVTLDLPCTRTPDGRTLRGRTSDGRTDGRTDGQTTGTDETYRRTDGRGVGGEEGRKEASPQQVAFHISARTFDFATSKAERHFEAINFCKRIDTSLYKMKESIDLIHILITDGVNIKCMKETFLRL